MVDGQQVNIPVPASHRHRGTERAASGQNWILAEADKVLREGRETLLELSRDTVPFLPAPLGGQVVGFSLPLPSFLEKLELPF